MLMDVKEVFVYNLESISIMTVISIFFVVFGPKKVCPRPIQSVKVVPLESKIDHRGRLRDEQDSLISSAWLDACHKLGIFV